MSIVLAAYLVRFVVGYQVPTAVQFASAPAWLTRPLVLISKAHEDAEPRAFQRRLEIRGSGFGSTRARCAPVTR